MRQDRGAERSCEFHTGHDRSRKGDMRPPVGDGDGLSDEALPGPARPVSLASVRVAEKPSGWSHAQVLARIS